MKTLILHLILHMILSMTWLLSLPWTITGDTIALPSRNEFTERIRVRSSCWLFLTILLVVLRILSYIMKKIQGNQGTNEEDGTPENRRGIAPLDKEELQPSNLSLICALYDENDVVNDEEGTPENRRGIVPLDKNTRFKLRNLYFEFSLDDENEVVNEADSTSKRVYTYAEILLGFLKDLSAGLTCMFVYDAKSLIILGVSMGFTAIMLYRDYRGKPPGNYFLILQTAFSFINIFTLVLLLAIEVDVHNSPNDSHDMKWMISSILLCEIWLYAMYIKKWNSGRKQPKARLTDLHQEEKVSYRADGDNKDSEFMEPPSDPNEFISSRNQRAQELKKKLSSIDFLNFLDIIEVRPCNGGNIAF